MRTTTTSPPVTIVLTHDDGTSITTALTVTAFPGLNGANITCLDAQSNLEEADIQEIVATVVGESQDNNY